MYVRCFLQTSYESAILNSIMPVLETRLFTWDLAFVLPVCDI